MADMLISDSWLSNSHSQLIQLEKGLVELEPEVAEPCRQFKLTKSRGPGQGQEHVHTTHNRNQRSPSGVLTDEKGEEPASYSSRPGYFPLLASYVKLLLIRASYSLLPFITTYVVVSG